MAILRRVVALLGLLACAALAPAHAAGWGDLGGDWDGGGWEGGDWGDFGGLLGGDEDTEEDRDNREDPAPFASEIDIDFDPDEILALNLTRASLKIAQRLGFRVREGRALRTLRLALYRLQPPRGVPSRQALAQLRRADPKGYYDVNVLYLLAGSPYVSEAGATPAAGGEPASAAPARPSRPSAPAPVCEGVRCYGQAMIGWQQAGCAVAARVGMLDTAVDAQHPALAGRALRQFRAAPGRATPQDAEHGTAVAALLVGSPGSGFPGLLPEATLVAADVFARDKKGRLYTDAASLARGLDWVAGQNVAVINLSLTGPSGGVLHTAVRRVSKLGIAVVAAAGNQGPQAPPQYPAAYPEVIAVTAVDRHSRVYVKANQGPYVSLSAPGVGIWTAGAGGAGVFREGTSFAAPFATAAVALLRARRPELPPDALLAHLRTLARDLGPPGQDPIYGSGLLQLQGCEI